MKFFQRALERRKAKRLDVIHGPERKPKYPNDLRLLLASYPPNVQRHPGAPSSLTDAEIDDNFDQFLLVRDDRLRVVGELLAATKDVKVDVSPLLDPAQDPSGSLNAIEMWIDSYVPERSRLPVSAMVNAPVYDFYASRRDGADIIFSLAVDLGLLVGEALRLRRAHWQWGVDRHPSNGPACDEPMNHFRRIVLIDQSPSSAGMVHEMDVVMLSTMYSWRSRSSAMPRLAHWLNGWIGAEDS